MLLLPIIKAVEKIYHCALRFVHCVLYDMMGWLSLAERHNKHRYLFIYLSPYFHTSVILYWNFGPHLPWAEFGKSTFHFSAPNSWNDLQSTLKINTLPTYGQFKTMITKLLASVCNCWNSFFFILICDSTAHMGLPAV